MIAEQNESLSQTLLVFAGIALFVGVFIIANTFTMLISQRSREIALMRAVGASRRQVVRSVLVEAALLGLVSSVVGFALGIGIAVGLRAAARRQRRRLPGRPAGHQPRPRAGLARGRRRGDRAGRLAAVPQGGEDRPGGGAQHRRGPPAPRSLVMRNVTRRARSPASAWRSCSTSPR